MRYISLFSGIEAASVAWKPLGWEPVAFAEIEPFPCAVLAARFPEVPNLGDVTEIDWSPYVGSADVIVGGSPCQSFSVAGRREGLSGESGLMFEYIRAVQEVRPRWFVWENVPGALSSEHGDAFRQLLSEMDALGYGLAWRVLDAQFFGVPQRRERLFLVGCLGDQERASQVLLEPEMLRGDLPSSKAKREELAADAGCRAARETAMNPWDVQSKRVFDVGGTSPALPAGTREGMNIQPSVCYAITPGISNTTRGTGVYDDMCPTLRAAANSVTPSVCYAQNQRYEVRVSGDGQTHGTLPSSWSGKQFDFVAYPSNGSSDKDQQAMLARSRGPQLWEGEVREFDYVLRRVTPVECERLQGFPDNWTNVEFKGRPASDTARYRAIGNSMAVPVMRWIGERIALVSSACRVPCKPVDEWIKEVTDER